MVKQYKHLIWIAFLSLSGCSNYADQQTITNTRVPIGNNGFAYDSNSIFREFSDNPEVSVSKYRSHFETDGAVSDFAKENGPFQAVVVAGFMAENDRDNQEKYLVAIMKGYKSEDEYIRDAAIFALSQTTTTDSIRILIEESKDANEKNAENILLALRNRRIEAAKNPLTENSVESIDDAISSLCKFSGQFDEAIKIDCEE
jgi:hypothetical protein